MQFEDLPLEVRRLILEAEPIVTLKAGKISRRYRKLTQQEREKIVRCTLPPALYHYKSFLDYTNDLQPIGLMYIETVPMYIEEVPKQYPEPSSTPSQTGEVIETIYYPEGYNYMYSISYTLWQDKDRRLQIARHVERTKTPYIEGGVRYVLANIQAAGPRSRLDVISSWAIAVKACGDIYREALGAYYIDYFDKIFYRYFLKEDEDPHYLTIAGSWITLHFLATNQKVNPAEFFPIEEAREVIAREYEHIRLILKDYLSLS